MDKRWISTLPSSLFLKAESKSVQAILDGLTMDSAWGNETKGD